MQCKREGRLWSADSLWEVELERERFLVMMRRGLYKRCKQLQVVLEINTNLLSSAGFRLTLLRSELGFIPAGRCEIRITLRQFANPVRTTSVKSQEDIQ